MKGEVHGLSCYATLASPGRLAPISRFSAGFVGRNIRTWDRRSGEKAHAFPRDRPPAPQQPCVAHLVAQTGLGYLLLIPVGKICSREGGAGLAAIPACWLPAAHRARCREKDDEDTGPRARPLRRSAHAKRPRPRAGRRARGGVHDRAPPTPIKDKGGPHDLPDGLF